MSRLLPLFRYRHRRRHAITIACLSDLAPDFRHDIGDNFGLGHATRRPAHFQFLARPTATSAGWLMSADFTMAYGLLLISSVMQSARGDVSPPSADAHTILMIIIAAISRGCRLPLQATLAAREPPRRRARSHTARLPMARPSAAAITTPPSLRRDDIKASRREIN